METTAQQDEEVTGAPVEVKLPEAAPGGLKLVVLGELKNSARKDSTVSLGIAKFLNIDASYWR